MSKSQPQAPSPPTVLIDLNGMITRANDSFCQLVGLHRAAGRPYRDLLSDDLRRRWPGPGGDIYSQSAQIEEHAYFNGAAAKIRFEPLMRPDGTRLASGMVIEFAQSSPGGRVRKQSAGSLGVYADGMSNPPSEQAAARIEQLESRLQLAELASCTDPLTGLKNGTGLHKAIEDEILQYGAGGASLYLVVVDFDDFNQFNDLHGFPVGDRLLRTLGRRLKAPGSVICTARIGGDKFALLMRVPSQLVPEFICELTSLLTRFFKPVTINDVTLRLSGSAGVSAFGADAYDGDDLFRNANAALIEAKRQGKGRVYLYDAQLAKRTRRRNALFKDLKLAIAEGLLHPVYQPIISNRQQDLVGVEVLSRWVHHEFGNVPPDEFIAIAGECGLLPALDLGMAAMACAELQPLLATNAIAFVNFNLSPLELSHQAYVEAFLAILQDSGIPPEKVCVEVTENELIQNFDSAETAIRTLKAAGVTIVLDDYGTGYSNLRALLDLPIDVIKIDKSLIADVAEEERAMQIVLSVVHLARVLGAQLVAEGIESAAQAAVTRALGCHYIQGFLISKPLRLSNLGEWLRQNAKAVHDNTKAPNALRNGHFRLVS